MTPTTDPTAAERLFAGGGDMGALMRAFDWSTSPLGPIDGWPQSLRSALSICLASPYPIAIYWGPSFALLYNDAWRPILGTKHPQALGRAGGEVWPEIWHLVGPQFAAALAEGRPTRQRDELLPMHRHGYVEECYFDYSFSPIRGEGDQIGGVFNAVIETTYRVITERRTRILREIAEGAIQAAADEAVCLRAAGSMAGDPQDLPFALIYLADGAGSRARLTASSGLPPGLTAGPADGGAAAWPIDAVLADGVPQVVDRLPEAFLAAQLGPWPERPHQAVVQPLSLAGGRRIGVLVAGVSARRALDDDYRGFLATTAEHIGKAIANARAFEEARRRADELAALDRAKTAFFSNVSHEFRTPLTLMLGPLEDSLADRERPLVGEQLERQQLIYRNGQRLLRLVNSLLDFSRIEAGRIQAAYQATELAGLTADLASTFRSAVERAGLALTVDCPRLDHPVHVDREMWEKVVLNLLSNAFKHTFEGGIAVRLREVDGEVELAVEDTGVGIPAEHQPRLFERFHRVLGARSRSFEGSGIGLALVQELVRLHGGSVTVASEVGRGSRFAVRIPLGSGHLPAEHVRAGAAVEPAAARRASPFVEEALRWLPGAAERPAEPAVDLGVAGRILVADDNADMREYVARLLGQRWHVTAVADGAEALASARRDPPDLIVSDVMMPHLDGFALIRAMRADQRLRTTPIILLSARAGEEARMEGVEAGADDYLIKPFVAQELLARVEAQFHLRRLREEAVRDLLHSQELLSTAQVAARIGVWESDPRSGRAYCTPETMRMLGLDPHLAPEAVLAEALRRTPQPDRDEVVERLARAAAGEPFDHVYRYDHPTLGLRWILSRAELVARADGSTALVGVTMDVTERKQAEEILERQADELRRSNADLEQFAYVASHDLKEPLRMVSQYLSLLERRFCGDLAEAGRTYVAQAVQGASRMQQLIEDLLAYSRAGRAVDPAEIVALDEVILQIRDVLSAEIARSGATIAVAPLPRLRFERTKIIQLFQNLLANAIKFRAPGVSPRVAVEARSDGDTWRFSVADNGIGIDPAYAARIFDVFQRLHGREYPGTGIGLAICKRIVEQHGGRIWVEPVEEGGSRFCFSLAADVVPTSLAAGERPGA